MPPRSARSRPRRSMKGASWEAVEDGTNAPTPLIGQEQADAVRSASMPISTASPICRAASSRPTRTTSAPGAASSCERPGKDAVRLRRSERVAHSGRRQHARHRGQRPEDRREISDQVDALPLAPGGHRRSWPRCEALSVSNVSEGALPSRWRIRREKRRAGSSSISMLAPKLKLREWLITDAQGIHHAGDREQHRPGPQSGGPTTSARRTFRARLSAALKLYSKISGLCVRVNPLRLHFVKFSSLWALKSPQVLHICCPEADHIVFIGSAPRLAEDVVCSCRLPSRHARETTRFWRPTLRSGWTPFSYVVLLIA